MEASLAKDSPPHRAQGLRDLRRSLPSHRPGGRETLSPMPWKDASTGPSTAAARSNWPAARSCFGCIVFFFSDTRASAIERQHEESALQVRSTVVQFLVEKGGDYLRSAGDVTTNIPCRARGGGAQRDTTSMMVGWGRGSSRTQQQGSTTKGREKGKLLYPLCTSVVAEITCIRAVTSIKIHTYIHTHTTHTTHTHTNAVAHLPAPGYVFVEAVRVSELVVELLFQAAAGDLVLRCSTCTIPNRRSFNSVAHSIAGEKQKSGVVGEGRRWDVWPRRMARGKEARTREMENLCYTAKHFFVKSRSYLDMIGKHIESQRHKIYTVSHILISG